MNKKSTTASGKEIILKYDRNLFARMMILAQSRQMDMKHVLTYCLGPLPWSLATVDGALSKTGKSTLMDILIDGVDPAENIPANACFIVDAMATLQALTQVPETFRKLAILIFEMVINQCRNAPRIDFVTDTYPEVSIKNIERTRRAEKGSLSIHISGPSQKCPKQWKQFLSNGSNKEELIEFLLTEWRTNDYIPKLGNKIMYVSHGYECHKIFVDNDNIVSEAVPALSSNQEEADTRMFLHAQDMALSGFNDVVILSPDTDVGVLACHLQNRITANLYLHKKDKTRTRYVDIGAVAEKLGQDVCSALPGYHALTGCDSVSAFVG